MGIFEKYHNLKNVKGIKIMGKENKPNVSADLSLPENLVIKPREVKKGIFGTTKKKKTFKEVIAPLATLKQDLKNFITERSSDVRKGKYEMEQIRMEIESDTLEIEEAEGSLQFIEQVIKASKNTKA